MAKQTLQFSKWCYTLNNPIETDYLEIEKMKILSKKLVYQLEEGENKTPHIQGYVEFLKKIRISGCKKVLSRAHWEKCNNEEASIKYAQKNEGRLAAPVLYGFPKAVKDPLSTKILKPFQAEVIAELQHEPDDRCVMWYWEEIGSVGKTSLSKHLVIHFNALVLNGKQGDMFNAIVNWKLKKDDFPTVIIIDIPRSAIDFVSWSAIEKIKDGLFYSGKYEGDMCCFNSPHVICFANSEPPIEKLSADRWKIKKIE